MCSPGQVVSYPVWNVAGMDEKLKKEIREHKFKVFCEPDLEAIAGSMTPQERRELARIYYRRAMQLFRTARAIENQARIERKPFRGLPRRRVALN